MLRVARYLVGSAVAMLAVTTVALAVRSQTPISFEARGEPWPMEPTSAHSPKILALEASEQDELTLTLSDKRAIHVSAEGRTRFEALGRVTSHAFKSVSAEGHRWVISRPRATLVDSSGREVRTIGVPPRATASLVLSNGDLAFLTPGASTLVSVVNQYGLNIAEFGNPVSDPVLSAAQNAWLNHGTLVETARGEIVVVFTHQPYPLVRRYSRGGKLLAETTIRSPGLDVVAAEAIARQAEIPSTCAGSLITVFGLAYDRVTDTVWITTASDDGIGYVRVLDKDGSVIAQVQLWNGEASEPVSPSLMAFGGNYLYWVAARQTWRIDASEFRHTIQSSRGLVALVGLVASRLMSVVHARQEQPPACGSPQSLNSDCPYNCKTRTITCTVSAQGGPWILESQHCLQPPTTPPNFKGCEKSATWCDPGTRIRNTFTHRHSCGTDSDNDEYTYEDNDCNDGDPSIYPNASFSCNLECPNSRDSDCDGPSDCEECNMSPIIIDTAGDGFQLTSAVSGVMFDLDGDGASEQLAWTANRTDDAWLALDRNGNGMIDDGRELFGNFTPQPLSPYPNGFIALAVFDTAGAGGNDDGSIDSRDAIFPRLWLWQDRNHDGVSQPGELRALSGAGLRQISLDYRQSRRTDEWGNEFRYRAKVTGSGGRWAYDVFLVVNQ